jgi:hypothetical protein
MHAIAKRSPVVFISHAGPDSAFAIWLSEGLAKVGIASRLDQTEIKAGDNIVIWMSTAVAESDYLLALLSPVSTKRYWVELEWSSALMKEAELRRTFVIPAVLPGLADPDIPTILKPRKYIDFRQGNEAPFLEVVARLKDDELAARDLGRLPDPAPSTMVDEIAGAFPDAAETLEVLIHSNRFGRSFRVRIPADAKPNYLLGMLRSTLKLKFSNVDEDMGVELSYTYYLRHDGQAIPLDTSLADAGVKDGDRLELWVRARLRDLIEDKDLGEQVFRHLYHARIDQLGDGVRQARKRAFSSAEIGRIASKFFSHVDE